MYFCLNKFYYYQFFYKFKYNVLLFLLLKGIDNPFFVMNIDQVFKCFKLWTKLFPTIRPFFGKQINHL